MAVKSREPQVLEPPPEREPDAQAGQAGPQPERSGLYDPLWRTGLFNVGTIARRELASYFVSPLGWVVGALLVFLVSLLGYWGSVIAQQQASLDSVLNARGLLAFLMVFLMPLYTMRLLAEERRSGTLEILLTSPVRDWELVVGKWLGTFLYYLVTVAFTLVYLVLLMRFYPNQAPVHILGLSLNVPTLDYGTLLSGYAGLVLLGATFAAIGVFTSSLTQNQIIAAIAGIGILLGFWFAFGLVANFVQPPVGDFLGYVDGSARLDAFSRGQVQLKDVVFFLTVTTGALFLTTRILESRKWR